MKIMQNARVIDFSNITPKNRRKLNKINVSNDDGEQYVMAKSDAFKFSSDDPVRSSFKVTGIKDGNLIVELKSQREAVIYDSLSGDILETSSDLVLPGLPINPRSVIEVILWSKKTEYGKVRSLCQFEVDGNIMASRSLVLNGYDIIPSIYVSDKEFVNIETSEDKNKTKADEITNMAGKNHFYIFIQEKHYFYILI